MVTKAGGRNPEKVSGPRCVCGVGDGEGRVRGRRGRRAGGGRKRGGGAGGQGQAGWAAPTSAASGRKPQRPVTTWTLGRRGLISCLLIAGAVLLSSTSS